MDNRIAALHALTETLRLKQLELDTANEEIARLREILQKYSQMAIEKGYALLRE